MDLEKEVLGIISEAAGEEVTPVSELDQMDLDSLDMVHILLSIENRFGVRVPDDKIAEMKTPLNIVEYLRNFVTA